jgi:lipopolysaccharide transport system permease protein
MRSKPYYKIAPQGGNTGINLSELVPYRDLFYYLVIRDIRSATHATNLGIIWVIAQPLLTVCILSVVMGYFVRIDTDQMPYPLFVISGLMIWGYFSISVSRCSSSMSANSYLLTKIYFPRIIIPLVPVVSCAVELLVMLMATFTVALIFGLKPTGSWLLLFPIILITFLLVTGAGLIVSATTSRHKDFGHLVPVILQLGMYLSPVFYPTNFVPEKWQFLYKLNPLVNLMELTRNAIMHEKINILMAVYPVTIAIILFIFGVYYFRICEDEIADLV